MVKRIVNQELENQDTMKLETAINKKSGDRKQET